MSENNLEAPKEEMTVGEILRNARTTGRRKREITTLSKLLCIREEFLQALEDGNYNVIPENVYILGFARNYAMELGLDPDEIVTKLKREMGLIPDCEENEESENSGNYALPGGNAKQKLDIKKVASRCYKFVRKNWIWFASGLVIFVLLISLLVFLLPTDTEAISDNKNTVAVENVVEPEYKVAVRERFGTENSEAAQVILQANQESWVKVEDARGNTVFSRVLVPGDIYYVPAEDKYKATFGNAGGVDIWVNGKLAPKQGANYVRKSGISLSAEDLMPEKSAGNQ